MGSLNINILTASGIKASRISVEEGIVSSLDIYGPGPKDKLLLVPSFIDMHVHFRDFEQKEKETVRTGSMAALAGGASAVCDMPNTVPPVSDKGTFERRRELFSENSLCDFLINYCVYDQRSLAEASSVDPLFIKVFLEETTGSYTLEDGMLEDVFKLGRPIALHSHIEGIKRGIKYSDKYGTPLHICHVSTREIVDLLSRHKGPNVTCEATPHHLFLSGDYEVKPPLCIERDRKALWAALGTTIDIVASDHAPHTLEDKIGGAYGISGVETSLPLMYTALNRRMISPERYYRCMHLNQVRILRRLGRRFGFGEGVRADFCILDISDTVKIDPSRFYSKAKHSPFEGMEIDASVSETWVRGKPFFVDGKFQEYCKGEEIKKYGA